jgi:hypothetical protein
MEKFLEKASACEARALSKDFCPATKRANAPPLDAVATDKTLPDRDNLNLVIQEARWPSNKLETDEISSGNRAAAHRLVRATDGSAITKPTRMERRDFGKDEKLIKPSEAAEPLIAMEKKPLKPAEPAFPSEKKQFKASAKEESLLKHIVQEDEPDPLDVTLDKARRAPLSLPLTKTIPLPQKRQLVRLAVPNGSRNAFLSNRNTTVVKRFKRPKFEQWYKEILQMDYFSAVGISNNSKKEKELIASLKKVPLSFDSESQYLEIFRPLVLEEFKAQLRAAYVETSVEDMFCGSFCVLSVERVDEFLVVRGRPDEKEFRNQGSCLENDLILLTKEPFKNAEQPVHVLGKVHFRFHVLFVKYIVSVCIA